MMQDGYEHIEESVQLRYVDGELSDHEARMVDDHLASCAQCRDAVDDLAAASDGLTAFLQQADFAPRTLEYRGARSGWSWASPLGMAAMIVLLLGGVGVPAAYLMVRAPSDGNEPVLARGVGASASAVSPAPATAPVVAVAPAPSVGRVAFVPGAETFTIEVTSWQAGGSLHLVFDDTDVFSYRSLGSGNTTASINTQSGIMLINTTADSEESHEVRIPHALDKNLVVRVGGDVVPFGRLATGATVTGKIAQAPPAPRARAQQSVDPAPAPQPSVSPSFPIGQTITIDLDVETRPARAVVR